MSNFLYKFLCFLFCSTIPCFSQSPYTKWVDPFIGTAAHGHTFPGATLPFGIVQLSPDTGTEGWDWCSGYHSSDSSIIGFSHTHLSGTGAIDYGDILLMPFTGNGKWQSGSKADPDAGYRSRFRHETEEASPGYYRVLLDDYGIEAELTTTRRAGFHRYTFPAADNAGIIVDLQHGLGDNVSEAWIRIVNDRQIEGLRRSTGWANDQHVYFVAEFSKPFLQAIINVDGNMQIAVKEVNGKNIKAMLNFAVDAGESVEAKVAISAVDVAGARKNLAFEIPGWDFDNIRKQADQIWHEQLAKIHVEGGTDLQKTAFYTALYHACIAPNLFMDVDGRYRGQDRAIYQSDEFDYYTVFSLWDTFRATHPLFTILEPDRTIDFIKTMLAMYEQSGELPIWELAGNETGTMIGYHAIPVIADAYLKGITEIDTSLAITAMIASAEANSRGRALYRERGFIPSDKETESVSKTLEYAYDDWCIARMAKALGRQDDFQYFSQRAQFYRNVFDAESKFMRGKMRTGTWRSPFDPTHSQHGGDYTEANAWQYNWFVPHDVEGLISLMGGERTFLQQLDSLFDQAEGDHAYSDISGLIGQYAHGNEPSHHVSYLYNYLGMPWKTQERVRTIMDRFYTDQRDGLCGNEDCGQMSAWYVFNALGFYPVCPGDDAYVLGSPIFEKAVIHLENGQQFQINAPGASAENKYIQSVSLNGKPHRTSYFRHSDMLAGGDINIEMGAAPNQEWGTRPEDRPQRRDIIPVSPTPMFEFAAEFITDSLSVSLSTASENVVIYYETNIYNIPDSSTSPRYEKPLVISKETTISARAYQEGMLPSSVVHQQFFKAPPLKISSLENQFHPKYTAGGEIALINGITGSDNFHDGNWQGYEAVDLNVIIELEELAPVERVTANFLQDNGSWIFMPTEITFSFSIDGEYFIDFITMTPKTSQKQSGPIIEQITTNMNNVEARYIQVRAKNTGICPDWHKGAGGKAWLFVDEISID